MPELDEQISAMESQLKQLRAERLGKELEREKVQKLAEIRQETKREAKALKKTKVPSLVAIERKRKLKRIGRGLLKLAGRGLDSLVKKQSGLSAAKRLGRPQEKAEHICFMARLR